MADQGVSISLIIEKAEDIPDLIHDRIRIYPIQSSKWKRPFLLFSHLWKLNQKGFKHVFIRISWVAAVITIITSWISGQETYYWLSGQGNFEHYQKIKPGFKKIKIWIKTQLPLIFIKNFIDFFVTGPESMVAYYQRELKIAFSKFVVLYNDIDTRRFCQATASEKAVLKKKYDLAADEKIILFVHRFSPVRKTSYYLPFIFDVFFEQEKKEDLRFIIVGDGPEKSQIIKEISQKIYADRILFLGNIPNMKIEEIYKTADIFIQPTYAEGFPRTLIEAMACGLPVVTTNAGGIKDILGDEQKNFMVDVSDRDAFADKMKILFNDRLAQKTCIAENLKRVHLYDSKTVAKMYVDKIFSKK